MNIKARGGGRGTRRVMGVVVLATVAALALPAGMAPAASPASALAATAQPVLRLGSRGTAVTTLQRRLASLRYDVGPIDGAFGYSTFHGVIAFQKVNGLVRDGIVGPRTWYALAHPVIPRPRRWLPASSLEVNLTRQVVYLARQGVVLRSLDASSGKASTRPRPAGSPSIVASTAGGRARWGCCGARTTSTAAMRCTAPYRCPPTLPATAAFE
jgi:N-acetylmuramoyl-L-alanine amidase